MSEDFYKTLEIGDKAGYNQAGKITDILALLRGSFIASMIHNDFNDALESCRGVLNIISGKVNEEIIENMNDDVFEIEDNLVEANKTFINEGGKYWANYRKRVEVKRLLETLWRNLESIQDEYGYGMFSEDESGL